MSREKNKTPRDSSGGYGVEESSMDNGRGIEDSRFNSTWNGQYCGCGADSVSPPQPHADYCPAKVDPAELFQSRYEGDTFSLVHHMASHLILDRGAHQPRAIKEADLFSWFQGLDPDYSMRELDVGHMAYTTLAGAGYFVEVV